MSAETAIINIIDTLKGISSQTQSEAFSLIGQANAVFSSIEPPKLNEIEFDVNRTAQNSTRVPQPPSIKDVEEFENPDFSGLQDIQQFTEDFTATPPTLNIPQRVNTFLEPIPTFTKSPPEYPQLTTIPDFSLAGTEPTLPTLVSPADIEINPLSGIAPLVPKPEFDKFEVEFYDEYENGLEITGYDLKAFSDWLKQFYTDVVVKLDDVFTERMQSILRSEEDESAVPDGWSTQQHTQTVQNIRSERRAALTGLDEAPSSLTGMPTGQRVKARLDIELKTLQNTNQSASKVALDRRKREVAHLKWAIELCSRWIDAAISFKAQEIGWRMKGAQIALDGATQALALAIRVLETKEKEIDFFVRYNETQFRRTELNIKIEQTKLTEIKTILESNQLKNTFNQHQIQVYQGTILIIEQRVQKYQTEIEYLKTQQKIELLKLKIYESQVKAFEANVNAFTAEQQARSAIIKGDISIINGELLKVKKYQAQVKAFEAKILADSLTITAQTAQNNALLDEYNALLDGKLTELNAFNDLIKLAVTAMLQGYDAEAAQMSLDLQAQDLLDLKELDNALRKMQKDHTETLFDIEEYGILFSQREAEGAVIAQGSDTLGSLATQAFAGLNGVGALQAVESA
jgi:hypothetical protein